METKDPLIDERCASELLTIVPLIMRYIRIEMRKTRGYDMTVPQFRTLAYLSANEGCSLSGLAEHIGLTLPSASKMVDLLVERGLVDRKTCVQDRRRVKLSLTDNGKATWVVAYQAAKVYLAQKMRQLPDADRELILRALLALRPLFTSEQPEHHAGSL
jgi:MarR family transcriptional regulator for hemolysin